MAMQIQVGRWSVLLLMPLFLSACSSSPRGVIILCAGDSITAEAYPHFLQQILNREGPRARVLNYGQSGNTSGEYLNFLVRNRQRLAAERPDFILLELGTNDLRADADFTPAERFASQMKEIVAIFRGFKNRTEKPSRVFLATIPPVPQGTPFPFTVESVRRVEAEVNPAIRALAQAEGLPLVDFYDLFLRNPDLLPGVHPSREGYRRMAQVWYAGLKPFLK
jgi:lysophospholipase L1-like esterase